MNQQWMKFAGSAPVIAEPVPLLDRTDHSAPSVFRPENMLREARRQKGLCSGKVPSVCVLDPDGDMSNTCGGVLGRRNRRIGPATTPDCGNGSATASNTESSVMRSAARFRCWLPK